jgi:hypothetical protein
VNEIEFDDLVGGGLPPGERERLRRTHDLLRAAGPPPELAPALRGPPGAPPPADVIGFPRGFPRRRLAASVVAAAAVALAAFGGGYLAGHASREPAFAIDFVLPLHGTPAAPEARASLEVGVIDEAGNWPMRMTIRNLPVRPGGGRYELSLTRDGKIAASCGVFTVHGDKTVVFLNAPYKLRRYDSWVVTRENSSRVLLASPPERRETGA